MENKAKKMFAAVAVIMLCAVAIVGVGYAYTASTVNDGNNVSSHYVTISQTAGASSDVAKYTFNAALNDNFDTITTATYPTGLYRISSTTTNYTTSLVTDYTLIEIGTVAIKPVAVGYATVPDLSLAVSSSGFDVKDSSPVLKYFLVAGGAIVAQTTEDNTWKNLAGDAAASITVAKAAGNASYTPLEIKLCYGYATADANVEANPLTSDKYLPDGNAPIDLASGTIVFTATITDVA